MLLQRTGSLGSFVASLLFAASVAASLAAPVAWADPPAAPPATKAAPTTAPVATPAAVQAPTPAPAETSPAPIAEPVAAPPPVAPAPTTTTPAAPAAPVQAAPPSADATYEAAFRSVVRVETGTTTGTGFVFGDALHVATTFALVRTGRSVAVVSHEGTRIDARILVIDRYQNLAVLKLAKPVNGGAPLAARADAPTPGLSALVIGHSAAGGAPDTAPGPFEWSARPANFAGVGERTSYLDEELPADFDGSPVLDDAGHVAGVVVSGRFRKQNVHGLTSVRSVRELEDLVKEITPASEYNGSLSFGFGGGLQAFGGPWGTGFGGVLSLNVTAWDLVALRGHFNLGWGNDNIYGTDIVDRDFFRYGWDAILEYRLGFRLGPHPTLISFGGGVGMVFDDVDELVASGTTDGACTGAACPVTLSYNTRETDRDALLAVATIGLGDVVRLNFLFDPENVEDSYIFQFMLGWGI
jgi:hypothetical protein